MERKYLAVLLLAAISCAVFLTSQSGDSNVNELFESWKVQSGMTIESTSDEAYRLKIFEANLKEIEAHNAKSDQSYKMGVNRFTGYTQKEFEEIFISPIKQASAFVNGELPVVGINVDWVGFGAVSPVKNQGSCQATYAFSAIGGIEGISYIYYKAQTEYSVQQLVDCSQTYGNQGCNSGSMTSSFDYIKAKGIY